MKKVVLSFLVCILSLSTSAQWLSKDPSNGPSNTNLNCVSFTSPVAGFVAGSNGLLKTSDGGNSWSVTSVTSDLESVYFFDQNTGYAAGNLIYKTLDGGNTWTALPAIAGAVFTPENNLQFTDANTGFVNGSHGSVYKTSDGGNSWIAIKNASGAGSVFGMWFTDNTTGFVVGANVYGGIQKTTNNGAAWTTLSYPSNSDLYAVHFINASTGWVVGSGGAILKTTDGGINWIAQSSGTTERLQSVHFSDSQNGIAVGRAGAIVKTTDGGSTWIVESSNTTDNLNEVFFYDASIAFAVGENNTLRRTPFPLSINEIQKDATIEIFPNPSDGLFELKANSKLLSMSIMDCAGRIIFTDENPSELMTIDLSNYSNGIYIITANTPAGSFTKKIIFR